MDDTSAEPLVMPLDLLRQITKDFSEERELGRGSFGKVYMGVYQDGEKIAVKKLYDIPGLDDKQFLNEFKNLTRLRHQNIVRLVGYCRDIQEVHVMYEGKLVIAERAHRALCLEYMSKGSLEKYLSDECDRYDWHTCYRIIKGTCEGLKYLHNELKPPIYHLDLKPANILLDENMVPRIADFGISRLFSDEQTWATRSLLGTLGYSPPEFIRNNLVSNKFDIFSLGVVIIKIMAGRAGYFKSAEMSSQEFTYLVQENWTSRLVETSNWRNAYSEQVKKCIEIGLSCVQEDRHKRPTIQDIVYRLEETETECTYAAMKDLLLISMVTKSKPVDCVSELLDTDEIGRLQIIKNDDLEELQELGSRTLGTVVYHGKWRGSDVTIKRMIDRCFDGKQSEREKMLNDFWNEASNLADVHHPNVVAIYGIVTDAPGGSIATVTEYMVNGSLRTALLKNSKSLDRRKRLIIAMDTASGMDYLHNKNIVHFDLKSDNLLVDLRDPERPICKVGDLWLSKVKRHTLITGGVRGALPWMAPELLNGSSCLVSEKVDVFSFGIVLWELLTGEEPYADLHYGFILGGIASNTLRPQVPDSCDPEWRTLMEQCWATEPSERPSFTQIAVRLCSMAASQNMDEGHIWASIM